MEFHRSAFKHGYDDAAINHAVDNALVVIDLDAESDPPKVLAIGPDRSSNLLELAEVELAEVELVIHAMPLRPTFFDLLPAGDDQQ